MVAEELDILTVLDEITVIPHIDEINKYTYLLKDQTNNFVLFSFLSEQCVVNINFLFISNIHNGINSLKLYPSTI